MLDEPAIQQLLAKLRECGASFLQANLRLHVARRIVLSTIARLTQRRPDAKHCQIQRQSQLSPSQLSAGKPSAVENLWQISFLSSL